MHAQHEEALLGGRHCVIFLFSFVPTLGTLFPFHWARVEVPPNRFCVLWRLRFVIGISLPGGGTCKNIHPMEVKRFKNVDHRPKVLHPHNLEVLWKSQRTYFFPFLSIKRRVLEKHETIHGISKDSKNVSWCRKVHVTFMNCVAVCWVPAWSPLYDCLKICHTILITCIQKTWTLSFRHVIKRSAKLSSARTAVSDCVHYTTLCN